MNPAAPCACSSQQAVGVGDYLVATLWTVVEANEWTDEDVIDEFEGGFDPSNTNCGMNGTKAYTGAYTGEMESTVLTMAVFDAEERAECFAREEEMNFVEDNDRAVVPDRSIEGRISFHFGASDGCSTDSAEDKYLSTCLWRLAEGSGFTIEGVADEFRDGYAPLLTQEDGFVEYGGAIVTTDADDIFLCHVFETREGGRAADQGIADFVANGALHANIEEVVCTEGMIAFDYRQSSCTGDNGLPDRTTSAPNSPALASSLFVPDAPMIAAAATACTVMLLLWACMLIPSKPKVYPSSLDDAPSA